jgi:hypothetical protein
MLRRADVRLPYLEMMRLHLALHQWGHVIAASNAAGTSADCSPAIITPKPAVH